MAEPKQPTPGQIGWTIYITVADLDEGVRRAEERGGKVRVPPRGAGTGRYCVIEDPAGAVPALFEPAAL